MVIVCLTPAQKKKLIIIRLYERSEVKPVQNRHIVLWGGTGVALAGPEELIV